MGCTDDPHHHKVYQSHVRVLLLLLSMKVSSSSHIWENLGEVQHD